MKCRAIPYEGQEPYLFLSYCHANEAELYPLFEQLSLEGFRVWYDDGNHGGDDWLVNIENHVENCRAMIAFISEASGMSHNCRAEVVYATQLKKTILPIHIDNAMLPKGLRMQLSSMHSLKRSDFATDKALMTKMLETEAVKACHTGKPIPLRTDDGSQKKSAPVDPIPVIDDIWSKWSIPPVIPSDPQPEKKVPEKKSGLVKVITKKIKTVVSEPKKDPSLQEKKPDPVPEKPVEKKPDPILEKPVEKKPDPVAVPDADKTHYEKRIPIDTEKTVYPILDPDATVWINRGYEDDDDKTVRIQPLAPALLVQLSTGKTYSMTAPQTKLGRSPFRCDAVIEGNPSISKYHADIIRESKKFFLRDAGSANGTFVGDRKLEGEEKAELEKPMLFRLYNEDFLILDGPDAKVLLSENSAALVLNQTRTAYKLLIRDELLLNRYHPWEDGTLSDKKISREHHALIRREEDGFHLVDESPEYGNGTYLNNIRLKHGQSKPLSSGDEIQLGDTKLEYVTITL